MIKKISLVVFLYFYCVFCTFAAAIDGSISSIIKKVDPDINMGMMVVDLSTGKTLYQRNPEKLFTPASNMKLFSEAAALMLLGPSYNFRTTLSTDAKSLNNGVLNGSIYLRMVGDPSFTQKDLGELFAELPNWGIKKITGNFVIVSSNSKIAPHAPGTDPKDYSHGYGAPVTPLILDENRVVVTVNPGISGGLAQVEYDTLENSFILDNKVKTVNKGRCGVSAKVTRANHLRLRGCIHKSSQAVQVAIPIINPFSYAKSVVKNRLSLLGIELTGKVILGDTLKPTFFLAAHNSKPITQLMANTLKRSDNLYADSLFLHTAQTIQGNALSWQKSEDVVKNFLQKQTGINMQRAVLIDGSGLSSHDLVTPLQTISLLKYIHSHFPLAYEYISALPIAGQDGTLWRRFRKPTQRGFLRAKTGTLTGVISLSGYLSTMNGHTLAFAIYINRRPGTKPNVAGRYMSMVDTLCSYLLSTKPEGLAANLNVHNSYVAYQQRPSRDDRARSIYAKWRGIEKSLKQQLQSQEVALIFRNNKILIVDKSNNANKVLSALQEVAKKYSFAIGVKSNNDTFGLNNKNILLWQDKNVKSNERTWYLQEVVS